MTIPDAPIPVASPSIMLPGGQAIPRWGIGTWRMGEVRGDRKQEVAALRHAISSGINLIDTAEMYGDGSAEEIVGESVRSAGIPRELIFLVSKVYPWNASRQGTLAACERSLKRLGTDTLDLYLLHWRGEHPLAETVDAFEELKRLGKIRLWGVSNFDTPDMRELFSVDNGRNCAVNQVYYNLARRWPEASLLPWQRKSGIPVMAYSPLDQGRLARDGKLGKIGRKYGASAAQIALAWLLDQDNVVPIPKSARVEGIDELAGALRFQLTAHDRDELNQAFPRPRSSTRMETT